MAELEILDLIAFKTIVPGDGMKKIVVLGCSGSGKSTFSIQLHNITKLPLYHLDNICWKSDKDIIILHSREEAKVMIKNMIS